MIGEGSKVPEQVEGMGSFELEVQCAVHGATEPGRGVLSTGEGRLQSGGHGMPRDSRGHKGRKRSHVITSLFCMNSLRGGPWDGSRLLVSEVLD